MAKKVTDLAAMGMIWNGASDADLIIHARAIARREHEAIESRTAFIRYCITGREKPLCDVLTELVWSDCGYRIIRDVPLPQRTWDSPEVEQVVKNTWLSWNTLLNRTCHQLAVAPLRASGAHGKVLEGTGVGGRTKGSTNTKPTRGNTANPPSPPRASTAPTTAPTTTVGKPTASVVGTQPEKAKPFALRAELQAVLERSGLHKDLREDVLNDWITSFAAALELQKEMAKSSTDQAA